MTEVSQANNELEERLDRQRYRRILFFFAGIILHIIFIDLLLGRIPALNHWSKSSRPRRLRKISHRFRQLALDMGGVMIKLGQFLSARVDILPLEVTDELAGLQDEVTAVPSEQILAVVQEELGDVGSHFAGIDPHPLAAASLGQVHTAWLLPNSASLRQNGHQPTPELQVVIKIQRPHIHQIVRTDLAALQRVAQWIMKYRPIRKRANLPALLEEFAQTLWEELDYQAEARHAQRFALLFADQADVRVPAVYWQHSTSRVLTLEYMGGIKINEIDKLVNAGINPKQVADRILEIYFHQIFFEGFFHADPHPGNLFIQTLPHPNSTEESHPFQLVFVDFGMMGQISPALNRNLQKLLVSVANRDAHTLTQLYAEMGFFLPGADLQRIEEAQTVLLERIWGRNLLDLAHPDPEEVKELGGQFRDLLYELPFQVPQDFIYLGRAIGMISGLASTLNPQINPWGQFEKFALQVAKSQQLSVFTLDQFTEELRGLLTIPWRVRRLLEAAESGKLRFRPLPDPQTTRRLDRLEKKVSQLNWGMITAALLIGGTLLYLNGEREMGILFWGVAGTLFLWNLFI